MLNFAMADCYKLLARMSDWVIPFNNATPEKQEAAKHQDLIQKDRETLLRVLGECRSLCDKWELPNTARRIDIFVANLKNEPVIKLIAVVTNFRFLQEILGTELGGKHLYLYPAGSVDMLLKTQDLWGPAGAAFPSITTDVAYGVDCVALGHADAAIYHFVRVAEVGLRCLARERRVRVKTKNREYPLDYAEWGALLHKLKEAKDKIEKTKRRGATKDSALEFYGSALFALDSFKDVRNSIMHVRRHYQIDEAATVMRQVRDFMNKISKKLSENQVGPIKWGRF
jgi:hypothetical protein